MVSGVLDASFKTERQENGSYPQHPANPDAADPARAPHVERYVVVRRQGSAIRLERQDLRTPRQSGWRTARLLGRR